MSMTETRRPRGRPRDPKIEPLMYDAALVIYAERGWSGFSLEAVGRQAGVSQGAMYRRWSSKAELLAEAINARAPVVRPIDTGDTREDLVQLARFFVANYRDAIGVVGLRMVLDARTNPELAERFERMLTGARAAGARRIVTRAYDRGDLQEPTTHSKFSPARRSATSSTPDDQRALRPESSRPPTSASSSGSLRAWSAVPKGQLQPGRQLPALFRRTSVRNVAAHATEGRPGWT
jgi:AcrR family transcriptional regulator